MLLDFGQINYIEGNYLKKKRPLRNKKRYYYAIQEQELTDIEAFGMYGNTYLDLGEVQIGLYGNSRYSTLNLITADNETFEEYFQNTNTDINYKKKQLVKGFVAADRQIDLHLNIVYKKLGLYQNSQPVIPVFKSTDLSILNEIANTISKDLVLLFKENDKSLKGYFVSSRYSKEITYEEFFIWWYHFFYTKVTEELITKGVISELQFNDVVKLTFFLTDISQMAIVRDIRDQYIDTKNPPASSAVEVRKLINDNLLIEIEAIAVAN
ncbi:hydrolase [Bacillus wiedmannii]|nr:hydrolase [Bacillus wiedmannii]PEO19751.1 RidA family protein [Bacillus wiedmannii]